MAPKSSICVGGAKAEENYFAVGGCPYLEGGSPTSERRVGCKVRIRTQIARTLLMRAEDGTREVVPGRRLRLWWCSQSKGKSIGARLG